MTLVNPHAEADLERDRTPETERYCSNCGKPLEPSQHKWCSRQCVEEEDGPYGPDDEDDPLDGVEDHDDDDDEPEPEDEEPRDE